jgi:hypothetical protein
VAGVACCARAGCGGGCCWRWRGAEAGELGVEFCLPGRVGLLDPRGHGLDRLLTSGGVRSGRAGNRATPTSLTSSGAPGLSCRTSGFDRSDHTMSMCRRDARTRRRSSTRAFVGGLLAARSADVGEHTDLPRPQWRPWRRTSVYRTWQVCVLLNTLNAVAMMGGREVRIGGSRNGASRSSSGPVRVRLS